MSTGSDSWMVISSVLLSLIMLTMTVAGDDAAFLGWTVTMKKKKTVYDDEKKKNVEVDVVDWNGLCKWAILYLWRTLDATSKLLLYSLFWSSTGGGAITSGLFLSNLAVGSFVYVLIDRKLSNSVFFFTRSSCCS